MDAISFTDARTHLGKTMQQVCDDHAPVVITCSKADSVVMMSLADYEALQETAYLLSTPKNARRLLESIAQIEEGAAPDQPVDQGNPAHALLRHRQPEPLKHGLAGYWSRRINDEHRLFCPTNFAVVARR